MHILDKRLALGPQTLLHDKYKWLSPEIYMLGYEKFIEMFLRFNILLDNFKGKRSGDLGQLNIHESGTERKCPSSFGS